MITADDVEQPRLATTVRHRVGIVQIGGDRNRLLLLRRIDTGSGRRRFGDASSSRINVPASGTYLLSENWLVRGEAGLGVLTGDAADSPIVEKKLQPSVSLFVGYKF